MTTPKLNIADFFIEINKFSQKVRERYQYPDLPEDEKKRIRSAIKIMKMDIEELLIRIGAVQICRVCGCTDEWGQACIEKLGHPCHWVEENLCSACIDGE